MIEGDTLQRTCLEVSLETPEKRAVSGFTARARFHNGSSNIRMASYARSLLRQNVRLRRNSLARACRRHLRADRAVSSSTARARFHNGSSIVRMASYARSVLHQNQKGEVVSHTIRSCWSCIVQVQINVLGHGNEPHELTQRAHAAPHLAMICHAAIATDDDDSFPERAEGCRAFLQTGLF